MISLKKEEDREQMSEVIQGIFLDFNPVVCWQVNASSKRTIYPMKINNVNNDDETLTFLCSKEDEINFDQEVIFFYSEEQKSIFKSQFISKTGPQLIVKIPEEIKKLEEVEEEEFSGMLNSFSSDSSFTGADALGAFSLDDDEDETTKGEVDESPFSRGTEHIETHQSFSSSTEKIDTMWITKSMSDHDANLFETELSYVALEEEDKIFEGVRSTPRAKPPEGKMITVQLEDESLPQSTHTLYDLSQGGLSFLVFSKGEFSEGQKLLIKAFDTKKFEEPMLTEVKAIREADDMGIQYKVGCQFIETLKTEPQ